ncbi:gamma subclass chorismate mutase AroQ [Streptomyces sp. ME19-01-6]|uniref:gamma subclass chorismate mutase AroQ n=1 Tax=Streptomyces sp. ME19-01-6 TaxID=3028686 RepID=UPI0029A5938F|nr:gamma subclass chorismate mutase AroQ [Streptomyces sp. ME19-01-6]MDX3228119.1 gamma subclass chorismate mutase AroQ [Streptomyces sp. ME19-01-6]
MTLKGALCRALTAAAALGLMAAAAPGAAAAEAALAVSVAAPASAAPASASAGAATRPYGRLLPIADLSAQRLLTADQVAAAKYGYAAPPRGGTGSPIDDPVRERQVLESVAEQARALGADPEATVRIFRDQIEANKAVQRGLFRRWEADPAQAPTERPDLTKVRLEINRINGELVRAIADSAKARAQRSCTGWLTAAAARVRLDRRLDALHTVALKRALRSVCAPNGT